jgi:predicted O-methyltransferase YrrM
MNLLELITSNQSKYNTDKLDLGYIHTFYNDLFTPHKNTTRFVLEIGIHQGASILLWRDFFNNAEVYGIDTQHCGRLDNQERIIQILNNAYDKKLVETLTTVPFDIIIDDGPHSLETMEFFIDHYLALLRPGGIAVIEDIIDVSWTDKLVQRIGQGYHVSKYAMKDLQRTDWHRNKWRNGLDVIVVQKQQ